MTFPGFDLDWPGSSHARTDRKGERLRVAIAQATSQAAAAPA